MTLRAFADGHRRQLPALARRDPPRRRPRPAASSPASEGFAQLLAYTDKLVGQVVDGRSTGWGLAANTLILFTGDNGTDRRITSLLGDRKIPGGKGSLTEAGTRVPLIARWPGTIAPGEVAEELVDFTDFFPTILDAAGVQPPEGYQIDGRSFYARLKDKPCESREWVYRHYLKNWFIRDAHYRLDSNGKLWNISVDPYFPTPAADDADAAAAPQATRGRGGRTARKDRSLGDDARIGFAIRNRRTFQVNRREQKQQSGRSPLPPSPLRVHSRYAPQRIGQETPSVSFKAWKLNGQSPRHIEQFHAARIIAP